MSLNCGCPAGAALPDIDVAECNEGLGQVQKVIIQRKFKSAGLLNTITDPAKKASWAPLLIASDSTKAIVSPYLQGPTTEPGAARTFGGGNTTLGGVEIIIGREPTTFQATMYEMQQLTIKQMKELMCENVTVILVDENGNMGMLADDPAAPTQYMGIPIGKLFVGDKKLGGYEEPDSNIVEWNFFPNWSDNLVIVKPEDFNPLTDLAA